MDRPPALPRRVTWFAPWTWSRGEISWAIVLLLLLSPALAFIYVLSYGPAASLANGRSGLYYDFYRPIFMVRNSSPLWMLRVDWYGSLWMGDEEWNSFRFSCEMVPYERVHFGRVLDDPTN
jgi:hypothetical protein